jgi:hypothetical protein
MKIVRQADVTLMRPEAAQDPIDQDRVIAHRNPSASGL